MRLGLFFGAGAETGYGLPSGGKFAIDLFRQDTSIYKTALRRQLQNIDARSAYASNWLPQGYADKRIHAFGRNEFTSLIESSIEYKRAEIVRRLNNFDQECDNAILELGIERVRLESKFSELIESAFGERVYTHAIRLNQMLARDVQLFGSEYYSAMLDVVRREEHCDDLKRYATSFLQLLVGAHGQDLVQKLNQELFEAAPDDLPIFDDIAGMFKLEFNRIGTTALELLLEENRDFNTGEDAGILDLLCAIAQKVLENIFTTVLDYQKLIDDHFRYLFSPSTEWAKFTKMVVFLQTARNYISAQAPDLASLASTGYYHDLASLPAGHELSVIGTANYNSILDSVANAMGISLPQVLHLNGSTHDYYNPYKNSVVTTVNADDVPQDQIHVPFILTQSGLKPLTSVAMSRRYVQLFDGYRNSDAIIVIGFGFHKDDSHINGLFRELVEVEQKQLYVISRSSSGSSQEQQRQIMKRLRIANEFRDLVKVISVDSRTRSSQEGLWLQSVLQDMQNGAAQQA
ncbi:hypothetical protein [Cellvibrio sp. OA-2007]|uniref:hypothetical protein n=1 Tax=Cellvibrio sp. OA-2007 TaxID=529823 RepID=UPI000781BFCC|nr:hypothetical protein [Cellvibrio sp. OA-2007]